MKKTIALVLVLCLALSGCSKPEVLEISGEKEAELIHRAETAAAFIASRRPDESRGQRAALVRDDFDRYLPDRFAYELMRHDENEDHGENVGCLEFFLPGRSVSEDYLTLPAESVMELAGNLFKGAVPPQDESYDEGSDCYNLPMGVDHYVPHYEGRITGGEYDRKTGLIKVSVTLYWLNFGEGWGVVASRDNIGNYLFTFSIHREGDALPLKA